MAYNLSLKENINLYVTHRNSLNQWSRGNMLFGDQKFASSNLADGFLTT